MRQMQVPGAALIFSAANGALPMRAVGLLLLALVCTPLAAQPCTDWKALFESVEGEVEAQAYAGAAWIAVSRASTVCTGTLVRVGPAGRAALRLPDNSLLRLERNTVLRIQGPESAAAGGTWIDILRGVIHVLSRDPRSLRFNTPYANAGVEGTEFDLEVDMQQAVVTVIEGSVALANEAGTVSVASGQRASVRAASAPIVEPVQDRFERAEWTPYRAPIFAIELPPADAATPAGAPATFHIYRGAQRLGLGDVDGAASDLDRALAISPANSDAFALAAVIALARDARVDARLVAARALELGPMSAAAAIAMSLVQQADFEFEAAARLLQRAVTYEPDNALAWARLAELRLALDDLDAALAAARRASELNPELGQAHTILGFALLRTSSPLQAESAFRRAASFDQASPLPRLGLSLALGRQKRLAESRMEMEIAAILDPKSSLTRSYLARIYAIEDRPLLTASQLDLARLLDGDDPTPDLFDALNKQAANRPIEAFQLLQSAIDRNDNQPVYRSKLLLHEDLGVRASGIGRLHKDLGYSQLALLRGWRSTIASPADHAGHRLLFDMYSTLPRHEMARASELFQAQMLQPINTRPIPAQFGEANRFMLQRAGPTDIGFNELGPLIIKKGTSAQGSAVLAGNNTEGTEVVVSGLYDRFSYSLGHFQFATDGIRDNNDLDQTVTNAFFQIRPTARTSLQAELRSTETSKGDLALLFDASNYNPTLRQHESVDTARLGLRHQHSADGMILASLILEDVEVAGVLGPGSSLRGESSGYTLDLQHLYEREGWHLRTGVVHSEQDQHDVSSVSLGPPLVPFPTQLIDTTNHRVEYTSLYAHAEIELTSNVVGIIALSADSLQGRDLSADQLGGKLGLLWEPTPETTLRIGFTSSLQGPFISKDTIQPRLKPTHVAGFNEHFFGPEGEDARRFGAGIDHRVTDQFYIGYEASNRDITRPVIVQTPDLTTSVAFDEVDETFHRAYAYWSPAPSWSVSAEYFHEEIDTNGQALAEGYTSIDTQRIPLSTRYFHPRGFSAALTATYVNQSGAFQAQSFGPGNTVEPGEDSFWIYDLSLAYRLPKRRGTVSLRLDNLFDQSFRFQDLDPENTSLLPERMASFRFTLAY